VTLQLRDPVALASEVRGLRHEKALALIKATSPVAWRHVHRNGHYTFRGDGRAIDLDAIIKGLNLE
jgi:hypothetical protein